MMEQNRIKHKNKKRLKEERHILAQVLRGGSIKVLRETNLNEL